MSVKVTHIFNTTQLICGGSEEYDDSVYWFISADLAQLEEYKNFFSKVKNRTQDDSIFWMFYVHEKMKR